MLLLLAITGIYTVTSTTACKKCSRLFNSKEMVWSVSWSFLC